MNSKGYILAIGEALVDLLTTDFVADLSHTVTLRALAGGSPANLCRFVRAAGGQARLVAAVGQDGLGELLVRELAASGLSTAHVAQLPEAATSLIVVGRSHATPSFIPYRGADRHLPPVPPAVIAGAAVVHTTAFALSQEPAQTRILAALSAATAQGIPVSVDWNYAAPIWKPIDQSAAVWAQLLRCHPLLKVSLDDVARFAHLPAEAEAAMQFLNPLPTRAVCLTCGAAGVWFRAGAEAWQHQPAPAVTQVQDATGAGDAFWAGFLTSWLQERGLSECVAAGQHLAARRLQGQL